MKRGTIILTPFPFTDLTQNKVRPALVVSSDFRKDSDIIIAFISSVIDSNLDTESTIILRKDDSDFPGTGLKVSSVIRVDKLATIDRDIVLGGLGFANTNLMRRVNDKLKAVLDLK